MKNKSILVILVILSSLLILASCGKDIELKSVNLDGEWITYETNYYSIDIPSDLKPFIDPTNEPLLDHKIYILAQDNKLTPQHSSVTISVYNLADRKQEFLDLSQSEDESEKTYFESLVAISPDYGAKNNEEFVEQLILGGEFADQGNAFLDPPINMELINSGNNTLDGKHSLFAEFKNKEDTIKVNLIMTMKGDSVYAISYASEIALENIYNPHGQRMIDSIKLK